SIFCFSSRRRHTRSKRDWSSDVCSSDLPSDDACKYGYLVPSNMFAVVVLDYLQEIAKEVLNDSVLAQNAHKLRNQINQGIQDYGTVEHSEFGTIYAYE